MSLLYALRAEVARLADELKRVRAAVRMHETARKQSDAHDRKVLTSLAGKEMASSLETLAQVREECAAWNARATEMEAERDAERGRAASVCREIGADERFDGNWRNGALACADAIERGEPCPPFGGQAWAGKP